MAAWKELGHVYNTEAPETIKQDAQSFFQTLPKAERNSWEYQANFAVTYWEDGTGQHAVVLDCPHDGERWHYALIYDRANKRVKVIKYSLGISGITDTARCSGTRLLV